MTEPPFPPLPPSGPPSGLNFSRLTEATPWPPFPAATCSTTRSTKVVMPALLGVQLEVGEENAEGAGLGGPAPHGVVMRPADEHPAPESLRGGGLRRDDIDGLAAALLAELHRTRDEREQRVVAATADAVAGVEVRAALADEDLAGVDGLAAEALDAEVLGVAVATVAGRGRTLLVCHVSSPSVSSSGRQASIAVILTWVSG